MKRFIPGLLAAAVVQFSCYAQNLLPETNFVVLTREHSDTPCIVYDPSGSNRLSLICWQREAGLDLPTNQVILVAKTNAKVTLPGGTPFGAAGQPFWILPQTQNPDLLYLGINAERVPSGVFNGPIAIRLMRFSGPGYFMAWQAVGPGQFNIRMDTRDGLSTNDAFVPIIGAHEHFNWGFSSTGVYCLTFQAFGQRIGESTNISSSESTFVFHVQPVPVPTNYGTWQKIFWPPGFNPPTTLTNGNPDGDLFNNLLEYAFGLSPTNADPLTSAPFFSFVTTNGQKYGALTFTRYLPGLDLNYSIEATEIFGGQWTRLTNVFSTVASTNGQAEVRTIFDTMSATNKQRFYRLRVGLK